MSRIWKGCPWGRKGRPRVRASGSHEPGGPLQVSVARPSEEEKGLGTGLDVLKSGQIQHEVHKGAFEVAW